MPRKPTKGKRPKGTTMRDVYVIGAYTTVFKKHPGMSFGDLAREAYMGTLADAGTNKGAAIAAWDWCWSGSSAFTRPTTGSMQGLFEDATCRLNPSVHGPTMTGPWLKSNA
jgi:hypothetical protein